MSNEITTKYICILGTRTSFFMAMVCPKGCSGGFERAYILNE